MPSDQDKASENAYKPSAVEDQQGDPPTEQLKVRTFAAAFGLGVVIVLASSVAFGVTCTVGAMAGMQVSQLAGAVSEGAMGYGLMTGITVGIACAVAVAVLLSRKLFRRAQ